MKKTLFVFMVALMAFTMASAQGAQQRERHGHGPGMNAEKMIEQRVNMLDKELSLSPEQKAAIATIYNDEHEAMRAEMQQKRADMKGAPEKPNQEAKQAHHEAMKAHQEAVDTKVAQVLNPEQRAKFEQMKLQRGNDAHKGRHGGKRGPRGEKQAKNECCKPSADQTAKDCASNCCKQSKAKAQ